MSVLLTGVLSILASGLLLGVVYLWLLALTALLPGGGKKRVGASSAVRFVIIVPAHNEEASLPDVLGELQSLDYPTEQYEIWVVADNCTDATASVARSAGVRCIERHDPARRGKGYALELAFDRALATGADAAIVIDVDADPFVSPNLLREFAKRIEDGQAVVQSACRLVARSGAWSVMLRVENVLEERLFLAPRERLGLPTVLRGTGMCFALDALRRVPFRCVSIAEDVEYTVQLLRSGLQPRLVSDALVTFDSPPDLREIGRQRRRWSAGHFGIMLREAPGLFLLGLWRRDLRLCEFVLAMLVASRSALLSCALAGFALAIGGHWAYRLSAWFAWTFAAVILALALYCLAGVALCRIPAREFLGLARLPAFVVWRLASHMAAILSSRTTQWVRTPRR